MQPTVTVHGLDSSELRDLHDWFQADPDLSRHERTVEGPIAPGALGGLLTALAVVIGPGGAATLFSSSLISWLRHRTSDVTVKLVTARGDTIEVAAKRVRQASPDELKAIVTELADRLS